MTRHPMEAMASYLTLSDLVTESPLRGRLVEHMRHCGWRESFEALSMIAARLASAPEELARELNGALAKLARSSNQDLADVGRAAAQYRGNATLPHEQVIYFLEALAILDGADDGPAPFDSQVAVWLLIGNEVLHRWQEPDSRQLSQIEEAVAELAHVARFNVRGDDLRDFTRTALMFEHRPEHAKLGAEEKTWEALQREAFGESFRERHRRLFGPLMMMSVAWGARGDDGELNSPIIEMPAWTAPTRLDAIEVAAFLDTKAVDRTAARSELEPQRRADGLPHAPALFYRKPLIRSSDARYVPASPWVVRENIRAGIWFQLSQAATKLGFDKEDWPSAFGHMFEHWCATVAKMAARSDSFKEKLFVPTYPGAGDEIEDVVTLDGTAACLFSAKAKLVIESVARRARSRSAMIDWFEEFFFGAKGKKEGRAYRDGAVRLLNARIDLIRSGKFADRIPPSVRLYPAIITFDNIGESPMMYRWLRERCTAEGLLQQHDVAPVAIVRIDRFEQLVSLASTGITTVEVLRTKARLRTVRGTSTEFYMTLRRRARISVLKRLRPNFIASAGRSSPCCLDRLRQTSMCWYPSITTCAALDDEDEKQNRKIASTIRLSRDFRSSEA